MKLEPKDKLTLRRVRLNRGGYDRRGRYWGVAEPLFCAEDDGGGVVCVRAVNRTKAKEQFPGFKFKR